MLVTESDQSFSTPFGTFQLPSDSQLAVESLTATRVLDVCFTTKESGSNVLDFVMLSSTLIIIPEPTDMLETTTWFQNNIYQLSFNEPAGMAGMQGDIVVLEPEDCSLAYTRDVVGNFPITSSAKSVLQADGVAREYAIAQGKFDELPAGIYRVCYATKTSEGKERDDFK